MTHFSDDLYLGGYGNSGLTTGTTASADPTLNQGAGPAGRIFFLNIVPATLGSTNLATHQHMTGSVNLALTAGAGVTLATAPDGSGRTVYQFDVPRCVALASPNDIHLINFKISGFDQYGVATSQTRAGPNANTVNTLKAFYQVLSIVPDTTDASNTVTAGQGDVFGMPFSVADVGYVMPKWAEVLAQDAGTFVVADATTPATVSTGDVRGTYVPSSASNGSRRLVIWMHLTASQVGPSATQTNLLGVTQV